MKARALSTSMPKLVSYSRTGNEPIIQIPYHPSLAVMEALFVKECPTDKIANIYRRLSDTVQKSNPSEMKFFLEKAFQYWDENHFEEAEEEFRTVVEQYQGIADGHYLYGDFLMKREKYKAAIAQLEQACRLASNNARYVFALGMALVRENRSGAALEKLKRAEELDSKNEAVLLSISRLYNKMGDSTKALEY